MLIWKLIISSCKQIDDHHFPFGDSIQYSGFDGYLCTKDESPFVPAGESVWEFGTDSNIKNKLDTDYKKRTQEPNGISIDTTTFCFATTRIWTHRKGIVETTAEKNEEGKWRNVRILDANSLELWLELCPTVSAWFAEIMGKHISGIQELECYWNNMVVSTQPNLTSDFFTYGRSSIVEQVISQINAGSKHIILVGNTMLEALLTFAAEIIESEAFEHRVLSARCIVVHTQEAFDVVNTQYSDVVIIPSFNLVDNAIDVSNNTVLIPVCKCDPLDLIYRNASRVEIQPRSRREFCKVIERLGYESNVAYNMGIDLRCNFNALYRRIVTNPVKKVPEWSKSAEAVSIIPALFAGSWEESKIGDKDVISVLSGMNYDDYITSIHPYCNGEDKQIFSIDGYYGCIAISDLWDILWSKITQEHFKRLKECFSTVFSETNPAFELPESKWRMASVLGKSPSYSTQLKNGMIIALIMLIERDDATGKSSLNAHISDGCKSIIGQVFRSINSLDQWRSICPFLTLFMEASPDVVIYSLEGLAKRNDNDVVLKDLFKTPDDFLFGWTFYTDILWAVEIAIWDKHYASRAVMLLVSFAEKQFEYKQANSPIDSLYRIFCLWQPQGVFTSNERKILLQNIISTHHVIAPELIGKLLATGSQMTHDICRPKWKNTECYSETVSTEEFADMREFVSQIYLENITPSFEDWDVVFSNLSSFGAVEPIIDKCSSLISDMCKDDIYKLCKKLALHISRCRKYHHENKSKMQRTDAIEKLYCLLLPDEPRSYAHYFAHHFDGLNPIPFNSEDYDYYIEERSLYEFQKKMVSEMVSKYGIKAVWEIIPYVENLYTYADIIADEVILGKFDWNQIHTLRSINQTIASRVVEKIYCSSGLSMLDTTSRKPEKSDLGWVLSCMRINTEIVDFVEKLDDAECTEAYWSRVSMWGLNHSDDGFISKCVTRMLEYSRPFTVIDYLAYSKWNDMELVIQTLRSALHLYPRSEANGLTLEHVGNEDIQRMFQKLYSQDNVREVEVAKLEIAFIRVFDPDFEPKYLVDQVLQQPALYVELLTTAYRPDNDRQIDVSEEEKKYALQTGKVLERIKRIPGYSVDNMAINTEEFNKWIMDVNDLAKSFGYLRARDYSLGTILSYAPDGEDGVWPAECVRQLFEQPHSETFERSFVLGVINQRGVYYATEGKGEDALADKYATIADKLQLLYPHTASVIRKISDIYRSEANQERANELKGYI